MTNKEKLDAISGILDIIAPIDYRLEIRRVLEASTEPSIEIIRLQAKVSRLSEMVEQKEIRLCNLRSKSHTDPRN